MGEHPDDTTSEASACAMRPRPPHRWNPNLWSPTRTVRFHPTRTCPLTRSPSLTRDLCQRQNPSPDQWAPGHQTIQDHRLRRSSLGSASLLRYASLRTGRRAANALICPTRKVKDVSAAPGRLLTRAGNRRRQVVQFVNRSLPRRRLTRICVRNELSVVDRSEKSRCKTDLAKRSLGHASWSAPGGDPDLTVGGGKPLPEHPSPTLGNLQPHRIALGERDRWAGPG